MVDGVCGVNGPAAVRHVELESKQGVEGVMIPTLGWAEHHVLGKKKR